LDFYEFVHTQIYLAIKMETFNRLNGFYTVQTVYFLSPYTPHAKLSAFVHLKKKTTLFYN